MTLSILCISLAADLHRQNHIQKQFKPLGVLFKFLPAIEGDQLGQDVIQAHRSNRVDLLTEPLIGEIGCFQSHLSCWRYAASHQNKWTLILEDDVRFAGGLKSFLDDFSFKSAAIGQAFDLIHLELSNDRLCMAPIPQICLGGVGIHRISSTVLGAAAYLVSLSAASKLCALAKDFYAPVDLFLFSARSGLAGQFRIGQTAPCLAAQDHMFVGESQHLQESSHGRLAAQRQKRGAVIDLSKLQREIRRLWARLCGHSRALQRRIRFQIFKKHRWQTLEFKSADGGQINQKAVSIRNALACTKV